MNRHPSEAVSFSTDLRAFGRSALVKATVLGDKDLFAANTLEGRNRVTPEPHSSPRVVETSLEADLPPGSWSILLLKVS